MRKIKDNGRTLKSVKLTTCEDCALSSKESNTDCQCAGNKMWRETFPSRLSRFIKRMVIKWALK